MSTVRTFNLHSCTFEDKSFIIFPPTARPSIANRASGIIKYDVGSLFQPIEANGAYVASQTVTKSVVELCRKVLLRSFVLT